MPDRTDAEAEETALTDPVDAARRAIWRLFENGQIDEQHATEALLAIDLGIQRTGAHRAGAEPGAATPGG